MLVQLAAHIFVLVALKLFLIYYCIIFLITILKFSIIKKYYGRVLLQLQGDGTLMITRGWYSNDHERRVL